ncbi:MAG: NUDIX domain-containing protein [Sumerlaeia bacterium]
MSELGYHLSHTDTDLLEVVDAEDRVVGLATRAEIHARDLWHRAVHVLLWDGAGRFAMQRRSMAKDRFPGRWDISVGGHVDPGESYLATALREAREEMGVSLKPENLRHEGVFSPSLETGWEFIHIFSAQVDPGSLSPDPAEVTAVRWVTPEEHRARASVDSPDPDWLVAPAGFLSVRHVLDRGPG